MIWDSIKDCFTFKTDNPIKEILEHSSFSSLYKDIIERESKFPSSIGKGVYLIRKRANIDEPEMYIGISPEPANLESYDGEPVRIVIFVVLPDNDETYAEYLTHLFKILNVSTLRKDLLNCKTEEDAIVLIRGEEEEINE